MTIRRKTHLFIFLLIGINFFGQNKKVEIDSLKQSLLGIKVHDTAKIKTYLNLSKNFYLIDIDSVDFFVNRALKLSLNNNNFRLARIYNNLGYGYTSKSELDSAKYAFNEALKLLDKNEDKVVRANVYSNYVIIYNIENKFDKALEYNLKAINLMKGDHSELCRLYYNQSILYGGAAEFEDQVKKYLKLAYLSSKKSNNFSVEGITLSNLANICIFENKLDSAKVYLEDALLLCEKVKLPKVCYEINVELGRLYDKLKMFEKANSILLKANKQAVARKDKYDIMISNTYLAVNEFNRKNYRKSTNYFKNAETLIGKNSFGNFHIIFYRNWSETEKKRGNYKKSNKLLEKSVIIKDSIYSQENRTILANADAKYEAVKKDKEIAEQNLQLQQQKTKYNNMTGLAIFLLIGSILAWFLFQQRQKRKNQEIVTLKREHQIKTLETLIEGEEKERFRIAKELHDGVNGDLSAIKFKLSSLLEMNNKVIKEAVTMIDDSCKQVRAISHNLVPPSLEKFNLLEATQEYCNNMDEVHTTKINFQHIGEPLTITKKAQINIYRIVQELITNSIKHAEASEINVQMSCHNKTLQITVEDNGIGYKTDNVKSDGIGLSNIQSRIDYLNASLDVLSNEKGTSTTIEIDTDKIDEN